MDAPSAEYVSMGYAHGNGAKLAVLRAYFYSVDKLHVIEKL